MGSGRERIFNIVSLIFVLLAVFMAVFVILSLLAN